MEKIAKFIRPSRITIPARAHPAAKIVFAEMRRQGVSYDELEFRSGVLKTTFKAWRTHNAPGLDTVQAALGALGWSFLPVPEPEVLKPEVRQRIESLADEFAVDHDALLAQLVREVANRPLNLVGSMRGRTTSRTCVEPREPRPAHPTKSVDASSFRAE